MAWSPRLVGLLQIKQRNSRDSRTVANKSDSGVDYEGVWSSSASRYLSPSARGAQTSVAETKKFRAAGSPASDQHSSSGHLHCSPLGTCESPHNRSLGDQRKSQYANGEKISTVAESCNSTSSHPGSRSSRMAFFLHFPIGELA